MRSTRTRRCSACPNGTTISAANIGPIEVPKLPPSWNTDCANPYRPPEASRAMRADSGWNTAEPSPTSAAAIRMIAYCCATLSSSEAEEGRGHADRQRKRLRLLVGEMTDQRLQQRSGELERQRDHSDLREVERVAVLQNRIDRRNQRLHGIVEEVREADAGEHDVGGGGPPRLPRPARRPQQLTGSASLLLRRRQSCSRQDSRAAMRGGAHVLYDGGCARPSPNQMMAGLQPADANPILP